MEAAKNCPFCNAPAILQTYPLWHGSHGYCGCYEFYIQCSNEECKIRPRTKGFDTIYEPDKNKAIAKAIADWNIRPFDNVLDLTKAKCVVCGGKLFYDWDNNEVVCNHCKI